MATSKDAKLQYEAGQEAVAMHQLTDSGDHITFTSTKSLWSGRAGHAPIVRPNGLLTGGAVSIDSAGADNAIDVEALTCNLAGVVASVAAGGATITRPATAVSKVNSVTIDSSGAIAVVAGTDGSDTTFTETRAAAGGPPLIPVGSIEIAQVRVTSNTAAPITAAQIFQVIGLHREMANFPSHEINYGPVIENGAQTRAGGTLTFAAAMDLIHTGPTAKRVYASYEAPIFADQPLASDYVPPGTTNSIQSLQVYGATIGSASSTMNQGSFIAYLNDGVTDPILSLVNANLWFKFFPSKYELANILCQGVLGVGQTFPVADQNQAACTISAERPAVRLAS